MQSTDIFDGAVAAGRTYSGGVSTRRGRGYYIGVSLLASSGNVHRILAHGEGSRAFLISISPFLKWAYILVAVGMAITINKAIGVTTDRIRHASNLLRPMRSKRVMVSLASQCALSAVLFGFLALQTPP